MGSLVDGQSEGRLAETPGLTPASPEEGLSPLSPEGCQPVTAAVTLPRRSQREGMGVGGFSLPSGATQSVQRKKIGSKWGCAGGFYPDGGAQFGHIAGDVLGWFKMEEHGSPWQRQVWLGEREAGSLPERP